MAMPSAPALAIAWTCSTKAAFNSSSLTWPIINIKPLGPTEAKTAACVPAARREISTPTRFSSATFSARPCRARTKRLDPKVLVRIPGCWPRRSNGRLLRPSSARQVPGVGTSADRQSPLLELGTPGAVGHRRAGRNEFRKGWVHGRLRMRVDVRIIIIILNKFCANGNHPLFKRKHLDNPPPQGVPFLRLSPLQERRMAIAANLGFPCIGVRRQLKRVVEEYWAGSVDPEELQPRPLRFAENTGNCSSRWASNIFPRTISRSTITCSTPR